MYKNERSNKLYKVVIYVRVIRIYHGEEVNIQPETEVRGSFQIPVYPQAEGEGYIVANYR